MEKISTSITKLSGCMVIIGMALVLITRLVRPVLETNQPVITIFFGILPNFGAAMALPFLFFQIAPLLFPIVHKWLPGLSFTIALVLSFAVLSLWEAAQFLLWAYPSDPYDILASGLGVLVAFAVHQLFDRVTAQHH